MFDGNRSILPFRQSISSIRPMLTDSQHELCIKICYEPYGAELELFVQIQCETIRDIKHAIWNLLMQQNIASMNEMELMTIKYIHNNMTIEVLDGEQLLY